MSGFRFTLPEASKETALPQFPHPSPRTVWMDLLSLASEAKSALTGSSGNPSSNILPIRLAMAMAICRPCALPEDSMTRSAPMPPVSSRITVDGVFPV